MKKSLLALAIALLGAGTASAQSATDIPDYDPNNGNWNGMTTFKGLAIGMGYEVEPVTTLEWSELTSNDILFLIYPLQHVEPSRIDAFVQAGGNVVIADDFGDGKDAMARLGLLRAEVATPHASKYQDGLLWAPIATPKSDHPIARDVTEVVTNHPAALREPVEGATTVIGFDDAAVVVAGERGTGRFVAVSDPSIFINRMLFFDGNVQLTTNILLWLDRHETGTRSRHIVLLRGDVPMYGEPRPFIDDPRGGKLGHSIADLNSWLSQRREWLLTPGAMKALAATLAILLLLLAVLALPVRRGPRIDGAWLRFGRPVRRDEPYTLVAAGERGGGSPLVLACILRDQLQALLAEVLGRSEPLFTLSEAQLVKQLSDAKGTPAGAALARVYKRLRALPSRGQAAAPWSSGHLARRDFDALYRDVAELCRTLGAPLLEATPEAA